jgi:uncharacterized membrane protein
MDEETAELDADGSVRSPLDLVGVLTVTLNALFIVLQGIEGPYRVFIGVLFVFVAPGYAFVAALFPGVVPDEPESGSADGGISIPRLTRSRERVTVGERAVLTVAMSVFIVPLVGLLVNFTPTGVTEFNMTVGISVLTVFLLLIAAARRFMLPPEERYGTDFASTVSRVEGWVRSGKTPLERVLTVALIVGIILSTSGLVYAVVVPKDGEQFTEFYLMTRDAETGELVADGYPSNLTQGERRVMYIGLTNREHRTIDYTVIMELQRVEVEDGSVTVLQRERLQEFETTVRHGQSWRGEHLFTPTLAGERLRLSYQLYRGELPANPTVDNAYRSVHVWVDVAPS